MLTLRHRLVCLALLVTLSLPAAHAATPGDTAALLAQAKAASGGDAWDGVHSLDITSKLSQGGLTGSQEEWDDVRTGAYAVQFQLGPAAGRQGYDGTTVWAQDSSGQSQAVGDQDSRQAAVSSAYRNALAYWYPERGKATLGSRRTQTADGQVFDVVHVAPDGGRSFDLWLDQTTHLLDRTVERGATETTTTFFSDYHTVSGVKLPFLIRQTNGKPQYDQSTVVQSVTVNVPLAPSVFHIPPPPPPDFAIAGGKSSVTVPFRFLDNHIYIDVKINGKGPFATVLDTGGANVIDPALAAHLHLRPQGALQGGGIGAKTVSIGLVPDQTVQIGGITLTRQLFYVIPLPQVGGPPLSTIVGYELFKRFVIGIDYDRRRLTLTLPDHFHAPAGATPVPFQFNGHTPEVMGTIDGFGGAFTIDTGSGGSVDLARPFVVKNLLSSRYPRQVKSFSGYGVGGPDYAQITRAAKLMLGGVVVQKPVMTFSLANAGASADRTVAGNIGERVLQKFNLIFDYSRQKIYFTPNTRFHQPDMFDRVGASVLRQGAVWRVAYVITGSPAADAGLKVGDRVLRINGKLLTDDTDVGALWRGPVGTHVTLVVQSAGKTRTLRVTLRELI